MTSTRERIAVNSLLNSCNPFTPLRETAGLPRIGSAFSNYLLFASVNSIHRPVQLVVKEDVDPITAIRLLSDVSGDVTTFSSCRLQVGFSLLAGEEYKTTLRHSAYIIIDTRIATADGRWPIEPVIDRSRPSIAGGIRRTHACVRALVSARLRSPARAGHLWRLRAETRGCQSVYRAIERSSAIRRAIRMQPRPRPGI